MTSHPLASRDMPILLVVSVARISTRVGPTFRRRRELLDLQSLGPPLFDARGSPSWVALPQHVEQLEHRVPVPGRHRTAHLQLPDGAGEEALSLPAGVPRVDRAAVDLEALWREVLRVHPRELRLLRHG